MTRAMRTAMLLLFAVIVLTAGFGAADAKLVVRERIVTYPIKGRTGIELGKAMVVLGPKHTHMRGAVATTATKFEFLDPVLRVENGRCVVKDVTVKLTITYQFPKWTNASVSSTKLRRAWKTFYAELSRHEKTHGRIARKYGALVERELKRMSGTQVFGCRDFGQWSKLRFASLAARLKNEQAAFDRREEQRNSKISRLQLSLFKTR